MNATTLRNRLRDLKLAKELIKTAREDIQNVDAPRVWILLSHLTNIEIALDTIHMELQKELQAAGFLSELDRAILD